MKIAFILGLWISALSLVNGPAPQSSIKLIQLLPTTVDKSASTDYTSIIQGALNKYDTVYFPPFPLKVNRGGLVLKSNQVIYFDKASKLILEPNNLPQYYIINIKNVSNVRIYNLNIQGDRDTHTGKGGEWGMGVSIVGSKNVYLYNPVINDCWGDGIYIGETPELNYCDGVYISGASCDRNRRNGVSIISGKNITIKASSFSNSDGTAPMCGIAIEPNNSGNVLENIVFDNVTTTMNPNCGIGITLDKWRVDNKNSKFRNVQGDISLKILNHKDSGSKNSLFLMTNSGGNKNAARNTAVMNGSIQVINPNWQPNVNLINVDNYANYGPKVDVVMPSASRRVASKLSVKAAKLPDIVPANIRIRYN